MATVYLAEDVRHHRPVALKVLKSELSVVLGADRFLKEIEVTAGLQHPHLLPLFDSGQADGMLYYVIPYVAGGSLRDRLDRETQLGVEESVRIATQLAGALDYAHRRQVIHRDIKPENILLQDGQAMLSDFGIALAVSQAGGSRLTETGLSLGTPLYMSPEQAVGDRPIDGRSDVYALAAVLYEMLTGEPPHSGATAQAIFAKLMTTEPVPVRVIRPALPASIETAIHRGLAKVREDRFATAGAMVEALNRSLTNPAEGPATALTGPRPRERLVRLGSRRALRLAVGVAVLGAGVLLLPMLRSNTSGRDAIVDARRIAVRYFQSPDGNDSLRLLADGLTEGLIATLAQVPGLDVVSSNGVAQFRDAAVSRDSLVRVLQPGTLIEGEVESAGASVRVTVRVVDAGSGAESQHASLETPAGSYLALGDSLARQAALFLRERLGAEVQLREQRATTGSSKAWVLWHQAQRAQRDAVAAADTGDSSLAATHFGAADSLATLASAQDRNWNAPVMLRATTLYRRSRFAFADLFYAGRLIAHGLMVVDTALRRDPDDPDGLELRGNLQYWKYLLRLEQNPGAARTLLANARADLERATQLGPTQAGAWASLSHLYYNVPDKSLVDVVLAARRAYEADAWLANAPVIIGRLFYGYYDMDQPVDAAHWCTEGHRRFPGDSNFTLCRLFLMTMRGQTPDPDAAWRLARSEVFQGGETGGPQAYRRAEARMQVSCVLARAGLSDSAKAVAQSALLNAEADPTRDLYLHRAACLLFAGDKPAAVQALGVYLAVNPERRREFFPDPGWRLRPLVNDPAYMALVGGR